ncbi:MAG: iron ABC transporter permease [Corynebacterium sp.]|uniref:Iron chelate uptake ABC transporter, FeCT family, permease protein n=2 Tax=Corynebacterium matruchotii TaxID=43768 RepID=E0DHZ4_9CORY|nr:iron ABC transporter permease [Corynebacterium matruchotii]RKW24417.1 MAG: iron ABC transporter permease [Corynebacterium sp.]EFM48147.1 iron chelate uptake ABC transporter, FeCT family, permease protein [Corynebacterium matruchotii ATCC 14266]KAB1926689.1 iron ABC transporter permease [Corynebacterium matruchotii]QIP46192.1 iron ABC transporter permease [Corynebacterium matruchotii]SPW31803.1 Iron(3+)-hydroxamate import system permease protein fhuG [Corynebacterium matruchotii]
MIITRRKIAAPVIFVLLLAAAAVSFVISLTFGSVAYDAIDVWDVVAAHIGIIPGDDVFGSTIDSVVWSLRAPRGLLALIVGAGLALAGVVMQTLVRNPLADPYLLGVSSGASVGATAVITIGVFTSFGLYAISVGALFGALAATAIVYLITLAQGGLTPLRLILTGVVASSAFSALASFLVFKAQDARAAQGVMFWMLGSVVGAQWDRLLLPALVVLAAFLILMFMSNPLDAMAAGPDTAAALGVNVERLRQILFFIQALLVGAMVAVAGGIGFVGLVIPHLARIMVGSLHRRLLPIAMVLGAVFMVWVDVIARIAAPPQEIPLGVVTGVLGAPLFLLLMGRGRYQFGGS